MYLVRHLTSGEFFLCNNVSQNRGWVTMVNPRSFLKFDGRMAHLTLPMHGKLSLKSKDTVISKLNFEEPKDAPREEKLKYIPPEQPPKKWWQRWF